MTIRLSAIDQPVDAIVGLYNNTHTGNRSKRAGPFKEKRTSQRGKSTHLPRKTKHATAPGSDRPTEQARQAQIAHTALKLPPSSTQHNLLISFLDRTNATITASQTKQFLLAKHEKWHKQEKTHTKEEMDVRRVVAAPRT
jgi:hypothetical protein